MTDPLTDIFDDFRAGVAPYVQPAGVDDAREKVRTRQRNRTVAAGVLAALVVAVPITVGAVVNAGTHGPPTATTPTPQPSASVPYLIPPGQNQKPSTQAPPGGISEAALYRSDIDLPAWPAGTDSGCRAGRVQFTDGKTDQSLGPVMWVSKVAYADVDHDGSAETFTRVVCWGDIDRLAIQVIGLKAGAGGSVRTLGQVTTQTDGIAGICDLRAGSDGTIETQVIDIQIPWSCASPGYTQDRSVTTQWRAYSWSGSSFVQSGGPTQFKANLYASDLALTTSSLIVNRQANGHYVGTLTLTVRNNGASTIPYLMTAWISDGMRLVGPAQGCSIKRDSNGGGGIEDLNCTGAKLAAGTSRSVKLKLDAPKRYRVDNWEPQAFLNSANGYDDSNHANDEAPLKIEFRG